MQHPDIRWCVSVPGASSPEWQVGTQGWDQPHSHDCPQGQKATHPATGSYVPVGICGMYGDLDHL